MSETGAAKAADWSHPHDRGLRRFVLEQPRAARDRSRCSW